MGYMIIIEGTDGSGKQTQTELLYKRLVDDGYKVLRQSFPNYDSPSSAPVKMYLGGEFGSSDMSMDAYQASVLFAVDRLCTFKKDLQSFYENDGIIILDRYVESNMLHQAGKIKDREQIDKYLEWLENLEFDTLHLPRADKVIYLNVPVEVSTRLANARSELKAHTAKDIHESNPEHLINAYNCGKYVGEKYGWTRINCTIDNEMRTREDISDEIYGIVKNELMERNIESLDM